MKAACGRARKIARAALAWQYIHCNVMSAASQHDMQWGRPCFTIRPMLLCILVLHRHWLLDTGRSLVQSRQGTGTGNR